MGVMSKKLREHDNVKDKLFQIAINGIQLTLKRKNKQALEMIQDQIQMTVSKQDMCQKGVSPAPQRFEPLDKTSTALQANALKSAAIMVYHCDEKIAKKARGLKTPDGHDLVKESKNERGQKTLSFHNEQTKEYDIHEEIFASRDGKTGTQFAAYYDTKNERITFNFGGTDFSNVLDFRSAAQAIDGKIDMRMTNIKGYVDQAVKSYNEKYDKPLSEVAIDMYSHSAGARGTYLAQYFLENEHGVSPRSNIQMDPFGAKSASYHTAALIAEAEVKNPDEILTHWNKTHITHKSNDPTFVSKEVLGFFDKFVDAKESGFIYETFGKVEEIKVAGEGIVGKHLGTNWALGYQDTEYGRAKPTERQQHVSSNTGFTVAHPIKSIP